ncbi:MAG: acetoacetate decarboxylase family protein [Aeromicrobium sp.]
MLRGFSPPLTPGGRSSLVAAPPWHYAGWLLSIEYELDEGVAASFLPESFGRATGSAAFHVADWQATTDGRELVDPVYSQYKEAYVLLEAERSGALVNFCPLMYVDQDVSLIRGLLQGLPKKLASIWLTRTYPIDHPAAAAAREGTRLGASVAVKDRRLLQAELRLTGAEGRQIGFLRQPTYGLLGLPTLLGGASPATPRLVRLAADDVVRGDFHAADATLEMFPSPHDELSELAPLRILGASAGYVGLTISRIDGP